MKRGHLFNKDLIYYLDSEKITIKYHLNEIKNAILFYNNTHFLYLCLAHDMHSGPKNVLPQFNLVKL